MNHCDPVINETVVGMSLGAGWCWQLGVPVGPGRSRALVPGSSPLAGALGNLSIKVSAGFLITFKVKIR